jgi:hypothetical protein
MSEHRTGPRHEDPDEDPRDEETVEELAEDAAVRNPDRTTRREALELDLLDLDRSAEGDEVPQSGD